MNLHLCVYFVFLVFPDPLPSPSPGFKRLTPSQSVGLKHAGYVISVDKIVTDGDDVVEVQVKAEKLSETNKPKVRACIYDSTQYGGCCDQISFPSTYNKTCSESSGNVHTSR